MYCCLGGLVRRGFSWLFVFAFSFFFFWVLLFFGFVSLRIVFLCFFLVGFLAFFGLSLFGFNWFCVLVLVFLWFCFVCDFWGFFCYVFFLCWDFFGLFFLVGCALLEVFLVFVGCGWCGSVLGLVVFGFVFGVIFWVCGAFTLCRSSVLVCGWFFRWFFGGLFVVGISCFIFSLLCYRCWGMLLVF